MYEIKFTIEHQIYYTKSKMNVRVVVADDRTTLLND